MTKQKKYNKKVGVYNGASGVTEHESEFLPTPESGTKKLDEGFESIYDYDILEPLVLKARKKFSSELSKKISSNDIDRINSGIRDFVKSSTMFSYNVELLKASILNSFDEDILTYRYDRADENERQMIKTTYFETIDNIKEIDKSWLIPRQSILYYKKFAIELTTKVIAKYLEKSDSESFESFTIYRGQGNFRYDKAAIKENLADTISTYSGIGKDGVEYFERKLLNSYTINRRVAEKFMVQRNNARRLMLTADYEIIVPNLFSSFIVSDIFAEGQYELLTLPSTKRMYIYEDSNDERSAEFRIIGEII